MPAFSSTTTACNSRSRARTARATARRANRAAAHFPLPRSPRPHRRVRPHRLPIPYRRPASISASERTNVMTTAAANATTPTTNTSSSTNNSAMQQLSGNMNTFLTLLTTQLQHQDPLSPMDSTQFTQQLVEYSQVEQQINTNTNLTNLISLQQTNSGAAAVGYLGKEVTATGG